MRIAASTLFLISLAFAYAAGLVSAIGLIARVHWPWQPLTGRSMLEAYALGSISHALAVIGVATLIGLVMHIRFRTAAPKLALLIALPATLELLLSMQLQTLSTLQLIFVLKSFLLIAAAPAAATVLMARLSGSRVQASGGAVSG